MDIRIFDDKAALGAAAAAQGAEAIRQGLAERGEANIIVATGASQFEVLDALVEAPGIDWAQVSAFHLDEYAGLPKTHPASFRRYLEERFTSRLPGLSRFVEVGGDAEDLDEEVRRLAGLIDGRTIDVCFAGIGENCHLAF
ncbi:MAG: 6-phosphogluconolactonase, partial [Microvirga sp.]